MSSPKKGQLSSGQLKLLQLKKEELKDEARRRSLPLHGNKIDLVPTKAPSTFRLIPALHSCMREDSLSSCLHSQLCT